MPESKTRKTAVEKKRQKKSPEDKPKPTPTKRIKAPSSRRWVPPTFITVGLLGVAWLIVYYVAGQNIPIMSELGNWNILIGMGGLAGAFIIATLWK
ncbi:cell division protein CrgA [Microlunatus speluncae]|uniref:cell division protein CrgA n=1 Tax=Microlunatus speluncae TaxID=2594267 RepID=UPI0012662165|nr:cell division protein CrgA [Microlunatus speluncae]